MFRHLLDRLTGAPRPESPSRSARVPFCSAAYDSALADLRRRFGTFTTANLQGIRPEEFEQYIRSRLGSVDAQSEGFPEDDVDRQRDYSIKFFWGHDHDFGTFKLDGLMKNRHIELLAQYAAMFGVLPGFFDGKNVFDIGCWTGGTSLALTSLGARVTAIEEVRKYADMATFLARSFGLDDRVDVQARSIYACNAPEFRERFDVVFFPGVIYHLTDPVVALRILWNALKLGGIILVESAGIDVAEPVCRFDGSLVHLSGSRERLDRSGWNWFWPSPSALERMMREAGFDEIQSGWHDPVPRVYAIGRKTEQVSICRAGLSVPDIP